MAVALVTDSCGLVGSDVVEHLPELSLDAIVAQLAAASP